MNTTFPLIQWQDTAEFQAEFAAANEKYAQLRPNNKPEDNFSVIFDRDGHPKVHINRVSQTAGDQLTQSHARSLAMHINHK